MQARRLTQDLENQLVRNEGHEPSPVDEATAGIDTLDRGRRTPLAQAVPDPHLAFLVINGNMVKNERGKLLGLPRGDGHGYLHQSRTLVVKTMSGGEKECFQVASLEVKDLWGREHKRITFNKRVNILIGRNASGKTTLLNILYYVLTADLRRLAEIEFTSVTIELRSFSSRARRVIRVGRDEAAISVKLGSSSDVTVPLPNASQDDAFFERHFNRAMRGGGRKTLHEIRSLVPTAWLPVSRRLSLPDSEDESSYEVHWEARSGRLRRRGTSLESVDHRLSELSDLLHRYRFQIEQTLSSRYKEFEQRVLEIVLFDEERDKFPMSIPDKESMGDATGFGDCAIRRGKG